MNAEIKRFPGISDSDKAIDAQVDPEIVAFCEDLVVRAKQGDIQAIAVALVKPGRCTADGWQRTKENNGHDLMASISYLQQRFAAQQNDRSTGENDD